MPTRVPPPKRRLNSTFTLVLLGAVAVYFAVAYYLSGLVIAPPPRRTTAESNAALREGWGYNQDSLLALLPPAREVEFPGGTPGITLRASLYPGRDSAPCGLVMAHGHTENRANMAKYAALFRDCGCAMLLFDHRGHGASDGEAVSGGYFESEDVLQAARFLARRTGLARERIGLVGESWGAAAVLLAAAKSDSAAFVLADSPYSSWRDAIVYRADRQFGKWVRIFLPGTFLWVRLRTGARARDAAPAARASHIRVPTLLVHAAADTVTPPAHSRTIAAGLDTALGRAVVLDWGAWHAHNALARPGAYRALVADYFERHGAWPCPESAFPPEPLPSTQSSTLSLTPR